MGVQLDARAGRALRESTASPFKLGLGSGCLKGAAGGRPTGAELTGEGQGAAALTSVGLSLELGGLVNEMQPPSPASNRKLPAIRFIRSSPTCRRPWAPGSDISAVPHGTAKVRIRGCATEFTGSAPGPEQNGSDLLASWSGPIWVAGGVVSRKQKRSQEENRGRSRFFEKHIEDVAAKHVVAG
jgi:hypothetical protein